ncbi:hypothetical protein FJU08_00685 [Martelella alba]|uniref:GNAT family N-acetyltransferase n=1 Tax=Martelella alba TaxID=2590451 RepID=A0A506UIJ2_9HYPH|nr:hypothetical protein [Martelella alba]TPW33118.1 hypothetical protein FJU08_00685 [Martelella alba]
MKLVSLNGAPFHEGTKAMLQATKAKAVLTVFEGPTVPAIVRANYMIMAEAALARHPALLKRIDPVAVFGKGTIVALATVGDHLELGMYALRGSDDAGSLLFCKGSVSWERVRGVVPALIAAIFMADMARSGAFASGQAIARILPYDGVNIGSSLNFARAGFYPARSYSERIELSQIHRAVKGSAEERPDGLYVRALEMRGKAGDIKRRSRENLAGWQLRFGAVRR